jgi:hypothetical protein
MCDAVLDMILDHDMNDHEVGECGRHIRRRRFEIHNREFLQKLHHRESQSRDDRMPHSDEELTPYQYSGHRRK